MKRIKYFAIFGAALLAAGCTGFTEDETILRADKLEIYADGQDAVTFAVEFAGTDATADAVIRNVDTGEVLEGNVFTTETPGTYNFAATHSGIDAIESITVTAREALLVLSPASYSEAETGDDMTRTFTIKAVYGTVDVSVDEELTVTHEDTALDRNGDGYYTITTVGNETKSLVGTWNGHTSSPFTVGPMRFYKRVGILEFTGTWCQYCSDMATYIKGVETEYPDRNVMVAVHHKDAMSVPYADALVTRFKAVALPTAVLDFGAPITNTVTSTSDMTQRIRTMVEENPAPCGIAISTAVTGGKVDVTVGLLAAEAMQYGLAVALVENGMTGYPQMMPDKSENKNYVHDHTLREFHASNIEGVSLGNLSAGEQAEREFSFDLKNYNATNCHIVVFATSGTGNNLTLQNAAECGVGESIDFEYESEN